MIPEEITLENFLSYKGVTKIDFSKFHSAVIIGDNGAGKSSILDGMTYALFGVARGTSKSGDNSDRLIFTGEHYLKTDFLFSVDGIQYNVIRKRDKVKQSTELEFFKKNGDGWINISKSTIKATQELIYSVIKANYELFVSSVMIMQGKADSFTRKDPSERKELLYDILGLNIYEKLCNLARDKRKEVLSKIDSLKTLIKPMKESLDKQQVLEKELSELNVVIKEKEDKINDLKAKLTETYKKLDIAKQEMVKKSNILERLKREEENLNSLTEEKDKYIKQINEAQKIILLQNEIETNYQRFISYLERERKMAESFENKVRVEKEIDDLKKKISDEEHELSLKQAELDKEKSIYMSEKDKFMTINLKIQSVQSELKELERIRAKKGEIEKTLNDINLAIATTEADLANLRKNLEDTKIRKKEIEEKILNIEKFLREEQTINEQLKAIKENKSKLDILNADLLSESGKIGSIKLQIDETIKIISSLNESLAILSKEGEIKHCPVCGSNISEEKRTELILNYKREIEQKKEFIEDAKKKIELREKNIIEKELLKENLKKSILLEAELMEKKASLTNAREQTYSLNDELLSIKTAEMHYQSDITRQEGKLIELYSKRTTTEKQYNEYLNKLLAENYLLTSLGELQAQLSKVREAEEKLPHVAKELLTISRKLETRDFALEAREKLDELQRKLYNIHYDASLHKELKSNIENFQYVEKKKKLLDEKIHEKEILTTTVNSLKEKIEIVQNEMNKLTDELKLINVDESLIEKIVTLRDNYTRETDALLLDRDNLIKAQALKEENIKTFKEMEKDYISKNKELENLLKDEKLLMTASIIYGKNGIPAFIIENTLPEIEEKANQILDIISDGRLQVYFKVESKTKKGDSKETL
ncbi:MAG TPA: SMC family ATPase, partial [Caldisericia bacterium]|nr:SMC family ATPase [Caldisericia bacterium]